MTLFALQTKFVTRLALLVVVISLFVSLATPVGAQANPQINYQGKLTNASGVAVPNGTYNMRFWLISSSTAATSSAEWTEELTGTSKVQVTNGLFSVMIGSSTPLTSVDFNQTLYLGVEIGGTSTPAWDGEMSPRKILGTVPAAFVANYSTVAGSASSSDNALALGGVASTSFLRSDEADTLSATSSNTLISFIQNGAGAIARFFSGVTEVFTILNNGNVGVGTTTPEAKLAVEGSAIITGTSTLATSTISTLSLGTALSAVNGGTGLSTITQNQILIGGAGNTWSQVATSSLGFGNNTFLGLTDIPDSYTANRIFFTNSGGTALTDSSSLVFDGTNFGIGTSTTNSRLTIVGAAGTANTLRIASSSGATTLAMLANGDLELGGKLISSGINWTLRTASSSTVPYYGVTYGNGTFVAVGIGYAMYSSDGVKWATSTIPEANNWFAVTYGNGQFVAIAQTGTNRVMTSPDGITWISRSATEANNWTSVTYGNGLFVAVSSDGTNRVMTSPDGITWAARSAAEANSWNSVTYGNGLFVAVAQTGTNRVMTSPDGINWTAQVHSESISWSSVTYGNGLFVAVSYSGTNRVMTSSDGINWTARSASQNNLWYSVTYGNGLFLAVSGSGSNRVMTSPDGINWTGRSVAQANSWFSVTYGNGQFVTVSFDGTNRVMTSGKSEFNQIAANNIFQGGTSFMGGLRAGTTSASVASIFLQSQAGINPFAIASSTGASMLTLNQVGRLGIGTTTPSATLSVVGNVQGTGSGDNVLSVIGGNGLTGQGILLQSGNGSNAGAINILGGEADDGGGGNINIIAGESGIFGAGGNVLINAGYGGDANGYVVINSAFGNVGIGTSTPGSKLTVAGDTYMNGSLRLSGAFKDSTNATGTLGMILQTTGTSTRWVATSTLGLPSSFLSLSDTPDTYTANRIFFTNSGATALTDSSSLVFDGTNFGIGTSTPNSRLTIVGNAGTANTLTIASSTGSTTLAMLASGDLELGGQLISQGINWTTRTAASSTAAYRGVTYGNGTFVAVGGDSAMYSSDGVNWGTSTSVTNNSWSAVTYGNGIFVAVSNSGIGNRVMTSLDGITWTARTSTSDNNWQSITYGNGLFVAVASTGTNRVMTSPDGINWTARSEAEANFWTEVTYGNGLFVAVARTGTNRVMTSPDGINWTARSAAEANEWTSVTYGNGLFVAVSQLGVINYVMTSPDGINWTARRAANDFSWASVTYGNGLFIAVSYSGSINRVMTSPDGITWKERTAVTQDSWNAITYGNGMFVAVSFDGTNRIMTSGKTEFNQIATNNIFQGGTSFMGGLRAGTTSSAVASIFLQSEAGKNPFAIASSTGVSLLTLTQAGNLGLGTTTPSDTLTIVGTAGTNPFTVASSTGTSLFSILQNGNVGIGSSTPGRLLSVTGTSSMRDILPEGAYTNNISPYSLGASTARWSNVWSEFVNVGTSTWSIAGRGAGVDRFAIFDGASGAGNERFTISNTGNVGIGSTTPSARLTIQGVAGTANTLTIASSSGAATFAMLANGDLELPGQLINAGVNWTTRTATTTSDWNSVTYGNGLFVAVAGDGTNRVMTSSDGINWTARTAAAVNTWRSVTYGNGLFVAVAVDGTNRVMTSSDGINWTASTAAAANAWRSVTYGNGLFVAVALDGASRVMTSPDGFTWTSRTAAEANQWVFITYGNGLFVAISNAGTNQVMTSPDGINWTARTAAAANVWRSVTYGDGLFVAVCEVNESFEPCGTLMTSPDGITWTSRTAAESSQWRNVTYGNGLFVAVSSDGTNRVMTSPDGITWTSRTAAAENFWTSVTYGNGLFVAVAGDGTNRVMTSGKTETNQIATNNIFQGGTSFMGGLRAGTTSASVASVFLQSQAGINPFAIASSTGVSMLTLTQAGRLGLGTTTPSDTLTIVGTAGTNPFTVASSTGTALFSILQNGNVGIGTTTQTSLLGMQRTGITGTSTTGLDQYFAFSNGSASAVQYGNRTRLVTTNTATTTLVGNFLTVTDSTTFGNTVRGLEVQSDLGTNTLGENTAISGYARTFGVRGVTSGDAGGSFEPAGVYGETAGTTQGNALRGYSSTITTASLLKLFQNSSAFTGTGLLMNFGNSGGSFSSTTASRFIDLQNAGTSRFIVGAYGMLTIGDGTTGQNAGLQIGNGGICVDNDGTCTASTTGRITSVSTATGNSDLAEMYFSNEDLEAGEVVYQKGGLSVGRASTDTKDLVLGVVSTLPGLIMGQDDISLEAGEEAHPIALSGRVPVKLSTENGAIKIGDELMLSSIPGVAMRATGTGTVIGVALEDFDDTRAYSETFINQFGESIIVPNYVPINRVNDRRINDGCYYGAGSATGDTPCVPLKATTTEALYDEADALAAQEAKEEALAELAATPSEVVTLADNREVKVGQVVMFVNLEKRTLDGAGMNIVAALLSNASSTDEEVSEETVWERLVNLANNFIDGVLSVLTLKADKVETRELCVDGVCVNANDLRMLLDQSNPEPPAEQEPVPEEEPEPTPEPAPEGEGGGSAENPEPPAEQEPVPEEEPEPTPEPEV